MGLPKYEIMGTSPLATRISYVDDQSELQPAYLWYP